MTRRLLLSLLLVTGLAAPGWAQTEAQKELPKEKITIVGKDGARHVLNVEMATTPEQQMVGEMFRTQVPADGGMLFDWGAPRDSAMWMRNTLVSLDMIFIDADGTVRRIAENAVPQSLATIESGGPVRATLEVAAGTARRLNIHVGDKVEAPLFGNAAGG